MCSVDNQECPNCPAIWGTSEIELQQCFACGYPHNNNDDDEDEEAHLEADVEDDWMEDDGAYAEDEKD